MVSFNRRIVRILEEGGHADIALLAEASEVAAKGEKGVVDFLLDKKVFDESTLLGLLADRLGVPPVDLGRLDLNRDLMNTVPLELAQQTGCMPLSKLGGILTVAVSNPFDVVKHDDLRLKTGCDLRLVLALDGQIRRAAAKLYGTDDAERISKVLDEVDPDMEMGSTADEEDEVVDVGASDGGGNEAPIIKLVNLIIYQAIKGKASDIHIEPFEKRVQVRYRVDGNLVEAMEPPKRLQQAMVSRIKIMSSLDIAEKRKPQDGKFQVKAEGRQIDFRVSTLPTVHGEKVVMRILDASNLSLDLANLGFERKALDDFRNAIAAPYGMILVTGPTGSGKTTTLYSAVKEIMTPDSNFVTVEDPVEYQLEGLNQVQVNVKAGLTFATALRSILRQDPDVVMVGEIRDTETIEIGVKAALTGHLVLSTLHTNDAAGTITRMVDMGVDPFMVASATLLVSAQRLIRRICSHCREPYACAPERMLDIGYTQDEVDAKPVVYRAKGCARCSGGYAGRFAILETLPITDDIKRMVVDGRSSIEVRAKAIEEGMVTLRRCALLNALRGNTSVEEVLRVTLGEQKASKPDAIKVQDTGE
jgi:type IV pilus assembly protein PilB